MRLVATDRPKQLPPWRRTKSPSAAARHQAKLIEDMVVHFSSRRWCIVGAINKWSIAYSIVFIAAG
jgi:hypothetical protein